MEKYITQNGIKYELCGEQYYPMLEISEQENTKSANTDSFTATISSSIREVYTSHFSRKVSSMHTFTKSTYKPMKW